MICREDLDVRRDIHLSSDIETTSSVEKCSVIHNRMRTYCNSAERQQPNMTLDRAGSVHLDAQDLPQDYYAESVTWPPQKPVSERQDVVVPT